MPPEETAWVLTSALSGIALASDAFADMHRPLLRPPEA